MTDEKRIQLANNPDNIPGLNNLVNHASRYIYFQLIQKIIFTTFGIIVFLVAWWTITRDISHEQQHLADESNDRIAKCQQEYQENNCSDKANIVPALASFCEERKDCMTFRPSEVGRSTIAARYLGNLVNEFLNPLSYKAMGAILLAIAAAIWLPGILAGRT
jgi:hypothetical protein